MSTPLHNIVSAESLHGSAVDPATTYRGVERRVGPRVELPFCAVVRGIAATGRRFEEQTVLHNLSERGLYVCLRQPVMPAGRLFVYVRLALGRSPTRRGASIALYGEVRHAEQQPDGRWGIAVAFDRHRFMYARHARHIAQTDHTPL